MSFNPKNLSYDANEPAFLRKLRGEVTGPDSDRHERPVARPKKAKRVDDEDEPTYVVEGSNDTLSKEEYEALVSKTTQAGDPAGQNRDDIARKDGEMSAMKKTDVPTDKTAPRSKPNLTEAGTAERKRKAAKVVADDQIDEDSKNPTNSNSRETKKPKKKAKAIKLSFGNEE